MSDRLERILAAERQQWSALVQRDDGLPDAFDDLCRRTEPHVAAGRHFHPEWDADSALNPAGVGEYFGLPADLAAEWDAYSDRWKAFLNVNPRCRLATILGWISETHDYSSWPHGRENLLRTWVAAGMPDPLPFDDRIGIVTDVWKRKLAETAAEAGNGWVYWEDGGTYEWR